MDEWIVFQSPARIAHLVKVTMFNNNVCGRLSITLILLRDFYIRYYCVPTGLSL